MADETKTTRGKKTKTEEQKTEQISQDEIIKQLMAQIEAQNKMMQELQEKVNSKQSNSTNDSFISKKVKVINLLHCNLNLSTEQDGQGKVYSFEKYGDIRMIKFDDLNDIISNYPNATENGYFYIANKDVVDYYELTEEYKNIYTKEMIDKIVKLENDSDVDLFLGMSKELQNSTKIAIANRINANERMDYNNLKRIKDECGIDIIAVAEELKENFSKRTE